MPCNTKPPTEEPAIDWRATAGNLRHRLNEAQGAIDQFVLAAERSGAVYCDGEAVENLRDITALLISGEITLSCKEPQE
jgi:hypothetical protein